MKVGIIGPGSQARKIVKAAQSADLALEYLVYLHREGLNHILAEGPAFAKTANLSGLLQCEAVIIASSNDSHVDYVTFFAEHNYGGYIFCEKPPAHNAEALARLRELPEDLKGRTCFNFNYRHSLYFKGFRDDNETYPLGAPLHVSVLTGHGLGFKEAYGTSWRASAEEHRGGILETVSIHFIDMLVGLYGAPVRGRLFTTVRSPYGDATDNSLYACQFENGVTLSVAASYTTAFLSNITVMYENGRVEYDNEKRVYYPRDTFDQDGLFAPPPLVHKEAITRKMIAKNSLITSVKAFFNTVRNGKAFDVAQYKASLVTNGIIVEAVEGQ